MVQQNRLWRKPPMSGRPARCALSACLLLMTAIVHGGAPEPNAERSLRLRIGDRAPPLQVMTWIKGDPVTHFRAGHIYVVEFWASWCPPCNELMPKLSELQRRRRADLTVVGVNVRESEESAGTESSVREFVRAKGRMMDYTVAMDDPASQRSFKAWMLGAGSYGMPTAFIVDRAGRLVWVGYPFGESEAVFEAAVQRALDGTSDLETAKALQEWVRRTTAARAKRAQQ